MKISEIQPIAGCEGVHPVMVPDVNHPCWEQFVSGKKQVRSAKATLNLMIQSNKMAFERDPSPASIRQLAEKSQRFFTQFESIFADELAQILR
jgi:hypothetical protein